MKTGEKSARAARMTIELPPKARAKLEAISGRTDQSLSEVIRRALALYALLEAEAEKGGALIIRGPGGDREIVVVEFSDTDA